MRRVIGPDNGHRAGLNAGRSQPRLYSRADQQPQLVGMDGPCPARTPNPRKMVYPTYMGRTNIEIDESLVRKARKLTRLKTKRQIVAKALELLVRTETRKGLLQYYGSGVWKGDLKRARRNRV